MMNTEEQKMKAAIVAKYAEMTHEQIADDVMLLVEKALRKGIDAGFDLAKKKVKEAMTEFEIKTLIALIKE